VTLEIADSTPLRFTGGPASAGEYILSPFAYDEGRQIFVRAVPRLDDEPDCKISRAFHGHSSDGITFAIDAVPALAPGPDAVDLGGVEDPTVLEEAAHSTSSIRDGMESRRGARSCALSAHAPTHW